MAGKEHVIAIESNNIPAGESGTTSSGVTEESRDETIPIESNNTPAGESNTTKIQKVPGCLRSNFKREYKPRVVSLGPIHHPKGKDPIRDKCKERLTSDFVRASGKEFNVLYKQIEKIIEQLRDCFEEEVIEGYDNNALASLLCKDGCAILQHIYRPPTDKKFDFFAQDILLLENQIPYKVLKELMQLSDKKEDLKKSIATFIKKQVKLPSQANPQRDVQIDGDHVHLLDLLRTSLLGRSQAETINEGTDLPPLRNVQELKAAGIHLSRSSDRFLSNISFRRRFHLLGRLYLPPITVDISMRLKLLNLVAYEMCRDFKNDPGVISYLFFLYSLIDEAQDFKELRDAGVLYIKYSELQTLFRKLRAASVFSDDHDAYIGVKEKIEEYYGTLMSKMLQFYHAKIKDSSWPLASFLVVLLGLFLSGTQTWFTAKT